MWFKKDLDTILSAFTKTQEELLAFINQQDVELENIAQEQKEINDRKTVATNERDKALRVKDKIGEFLNG